MNLKKSLFCAFAIFSITGFFLFCNPKSEKQEASKVRTALDVQAAENDYLKKRREYAGGYRYTNIGSLRIADQLAISDLEGRLKAILKRSRFRGNGNITIETFLSGIGSDMLDGLVFEKDSATRIFHTTQNLYRKYFKEKEGKDSSQNMSALHFENVFSYTFQSDAHVNSYSFFKIDSPDSIDVYGMVAQLGQGDSTWPPQYLYVFVSKKEFIYMAEIALKTPIHGIRKCEVIMDSLESPEKYQRPLQSSALIDSLSERKVVDPYHRYYNCYSEELKHDPQFSGIRKQMQFIASYLINPEVN